MSKTFDSEFNQTERYMHNSQITLRELEYLAELYAKQLSDKINEKLVGGASGDE